MATPARLLAALLCGLLVTGCCDARSAEVTVHVHLDATLAAALPEADAQSGRQAEVAEVAEVAVVAPSSHRSGGWASAVGNATFSGGNSVGSGWDAGVAVVAVLAVVAVVLVGVAVWKIGEAVSTRHAAPPLTSYALSLGGGAQPALLLYLRDGHAIHLDAGLAAALTRGEYSRYTLQRTGSQVALPVQVELAGTLLSVHLLRPALPH